MLEVHTDILQDGGQLLRQLREFLTTPLDQLPQSAFWITCICRKLARKNTSHFFLTKEFYCLDQYTPALFNSLILVHNLYWVKRIGSKSKCKIIVIRSE